MNKLTSAINNITESAKSKGKYLMMTAALAGALSGTSCSGEKKAETDTQEVKTEVIAQNSTSETVTAEVQTSEKPVEEKSLDELSDDDFDEIFSYTPSEEEKKALQAEGKKAQQLEQQESEQIRQTYREAIANGETEAIIKDIKKDISNDFLRENSEYLASTKKVLINYIEVHKTAGISISENAKTVIAKYNSHVSKKDQIKY